VLSITSLILALTFRKQIIFVGLSITKLDIVLLTILIKRIFRIFNFIVKRTKVEKYLFRVVHFDLWFIYRHLISKLSQ